ARHFDIHRYNEDAWHCGDSHVDVFRCREFSSADLLLPLYAGGFHSSMRYLGARVTESTENPRIPQYECGFPFPPRPRGSEDYHWSTLPRCGTSRERRSRGITKSADAPIDLLRFAGHLVVPIHEGAVGVVSPGPDV